MFIFTAKLNKKKAVASVLIAGFLLCLLVNCVAHGKSRAAYMGDQAMEQMSEPVLKTIKNDEQRLKYLSSLGWQSGGGLAEAQAVSIPEEFDQTYEKYNLIQNECGFDLSKYKGKQATVYTYYIDNYPTGEKNVRANLIICKNKLVGGDICSSELDGFMHGLVKREAE